MKHIREVKITITIDTNKATYSSGFESIEDAIEYYNRIIQQVAPNRQEELCWKGVVQAANTFIDERELVNHLKENYTIQPKSK